MDNIEVKMLTKRFGEIDPLSIDDYIKADGYKALEKAASMSADNIIERIKLKLQSSKAEAEQASRWGSRCRL